MRAKKGNLGWVHEHFYKELTLIKYKRLLRLTKIDLMHQKFFTKAPVNSFLVVYNFCMRKFLSKSVSSSTLSNDRHGFYSKGNSSIEIKSLPKSFLMTPSNVSILSFPQSLSVFLKFSYNYFFAILKSLSISLIFLCNSSTHISLLFLKYTFLILSICNSL